MQWTKTIVVPSLCAAAMLICACRNDARPTRAKEQFEVEVMNPSTPVKNQGRSQTCWIYAMLAAIETEHIGRGDSINLSPHYAIRKMLEDEAQVAYLSNGKATISTRGTAMKALRLLQSHGMVPYNAYWRGKNVNTNVLGRKIMVGIRTAQATKAGLDACNDGVGSMLHAAFGPEPQRVFMLHAEYTPQEFARSVCAPDEYEALTSFTHHPFGSRFAIEVPDNTDRDLCLNVPIDTLMDRVERAVRQHRGVCWEGDTSEPGLSFAKGVARLPQGCDVSQAARQRAFERFETTDDHCMAIVGIAHDKEGRKFFIMKNSYGKTNAYGGFMYVSFDYVRMKTIAVLVSRGY